MSLSMYNVKFTDSKELSVELEFIIARNKVEGNELIKLTLENTDMQQKYKSAVTRLLKSIKREGVIQLFIFEEDLILQEKTESIYLLNKFPFLSEIKNTDPSALYIKV